MSVKYIAPAKNFEYDSSFHKTPPHIEPHFHQSYEIYMLVEGDAVYSVEGHIYEMAPGDVFFTNKKEMHLPIFRSAAPYSRKIITCGQSFLSEFITEEFNPFDVLQKRKIGEKNKIESAVAKALGIHQKFAEIEELSKSTLPETNSLIKCSLFQLLTMVRKAVGFSAKEYRHHEKTHEIVHYINENLTEDLSLEALQKRFFLNKFYLSHVFKEQTGFSIGDFVTVKRIIKAKELLLSGVSASAAAQLSGFGDYSGFYRSFKKITGVSPKNYKN